jgi:two-component system response regulator DctR
MDLDNITLKNIKKTEESELPKGLNELTLKQILNYMIIIHEAQSAEEVAKGTGLARVTVRRYLDYLEKTERIKLEIQYGSVGRPINKYSI